MKKIDHQTLAWRLGVLISKVSCADVHEADVLHGDVNTQLWLSRSFRAMSTILACHISITVYYVHLVFSLQST